MKHAPVLHRIEYVSFRAMSALLMALPHPAARSVGRGLGDLLWLALGSRRRVALSNLEMALPGLSLQKRQRLAVESFRHTDSIVESCAGG